MAIVDEQAQVLTRTRVTEDLAGVSQLLALLAEHSDDQPASIDIAIETDKGLLVAALVAAGFTVFPINLRAAARYRERASPTKSAPPFGRPHYDNPHPSNTP